MADKTSSARNIKATLGYRECGPAPLGYKWTGPRSAKILEIEETEASTVRLIFEKFLELGTIRKTFEYVNSHGHKTKKGNITRDSVGKILRNKFYIGVLVKGDREIQAKHAAIVTPEQFAQETF